MSCSKQSMLVTIPESGSYILFNVQEQDADVLTKVSVVNASTFNTDGFQASATTGVEGDEVSVWNNVTFYNYGTQFKADKVWPSSNMYYHFYASNVAISHNGNGCTVAAANDTDVVCAYLSEPGFKSVNTLVFEHIFARIGDVTTTAESGYTITGISMNITLRTGGTFNLRTGSGMTDGTGWSSISTANSSTNIAYSTPNTNSNDLYLVPGAYNITVSWTATRGAYTKTLSKTFTGVELVGGKINNFTATLGGDAAAVKLGVRVLPWLQDRIDLNIVDAS